MDSESKKKEEANIMPRLRSINLEPCRGVRRSSMLVDDEEEEEVERGVAPLEFCEGRLVGNSSRCFVASIGLKEEGGLSLGMLEERRLRGGGHASHTQEHPRRADRV
ncbi:hypothetical protein KM043_003747 [Ampulex compressa]|nr:hypothetical protein KM043_003747 [Ampulex compressa]